MAPLLDAIIPALFSFGDTYCPGAKSTTVTQGEMSVNPPVEVVWCGENAAAEGPMVAAPCFAVSRFFRAACYTVATRKEYARRIA